MTRGLRSLSWNWFLAAYVALIAVLLFAPLVAHAATPRFSVADGSVIEGNSFQPIATKNAKANSYSKITFHVARGTCAEDRIVIPPPFTVTVSNKQLTVYGPMVSTVDNAQVDGDCTAVVWIEAVRFATISGVGAAWTIRNDDIGLPSPPATNWVSAPLRDDGYARCKVAGGCHSEGTGQAPIIAQAGEVRQQAWNGVAACMTADNSCRIIAALWPVGHDPRVTKAASDWYLGAEGFQDEWEGVAPAP